MRAVAFLALALLVITPSATARSSGGTPIALATAETEDALLAVSFGDRRIVRRVHMPHDPQNVVSDGQNVVVVSPGAGAVTILDGQTLHVRKVLRGLGAPHLAAFDPSGEWAFVTDDERGQLDVLSLESPRIVKRLFVGLGAHHLSVSALGTRTWIALGEHARQIAIVDTSRPARPRVLRRFDPGFVAHDLAFSPNGSRVWVTSAEDRTVRVLSAVTGRVLFSVAAGLPPQHVAFGAYSRTQAYITSGYSGRIEEVDRRTGKVRRVRSTPYGSFNLTLIGGNVVAASLLRGTVTDFSSDLRLLTSVHVAPATRAVAGVVWP